jgi:hypothetical protein
MSSSRYPNNWNEIAYQVKEAAQWRCAKCGMQCLRPGDDVSRMSKSERMRRTLTVHHLNYKPEDSRIENLIAVCSADHLALFHSGRRGNVSPGQLSLFD